MLAMLAASPSLRAPESSNPALEDVETGAAKTGAAEAAARMRMAEVARILVMGLERLNGGMDSRENNMDLYRKTANKLSKKSQANKGDEHRCA
jgi:hypothetical protein